MDFSLNGLLSAVILTLRDPRAGVRLVLSVDLTRRERWDLLLLTVVLSAILEKLSIFLTLTPDADLWILASPPLTLGLILLMLMLFAVYAVNFVGRRFGGHGDLNGAISILVWLQFVMICLQVVQLVLLVVSPLLAFFLGVVGLVLFFWLLTQFIMELHGFKSAVSVFLGVFLCLFAFATILSILLGMFSVVVPGVANV